MLKNTVIIALIILAIYLYYQNRKLNQLPSNSNGSDDSRSFEWEESRPRKTALIFDQDDEELVAEKDAAIRSKNEAEQEVLSLSNKLKNKQQEISRKEQEIERLKKEKSQSEISLNGKLKEKNGLITTLQREVNQSKEKIKQLEIKIKELEDSYSDAPEEPEND